MSLAACAGSGKALLPGKKLLGADIVCNATTGYCSGPTPPPPNYSQTGGVNPKQWTTFAEYSAGTNKMSAGHDDWSLVAHGANDASGNLLYTGTSTFAVSGSQYAVGTSISSSALPTELSGTVYIPQNIPSNGTCQTSVGILDTTNQSTLGTLHFTAQGVPCTATLTPTDNTGLNFTVDYKNLNTGYVATFTVVLPTGFTRGECWAIGAAATALALIALILAAVAVPEALAGAAYWAAINGTITGLNWAALIAGAAGMIGCL